MAKALTSHDSSYKTLSRAERGGEEEGLQYFSLVSGCNRATIAITLSVLLNHSFSGPMTRESKIFWVLFLFPLVISKLLAYLVLSLEYVEGKKKTKETTSLWFLRSQSPWLVFFSLHVSESSHAFICI